MTATHTTTAQLIIDDAAFLAGRKDIGNALEPEEVEIFLRLLNDIVKQWEGRGVHLHTIDEVTVPLTVATQSYTVSLTGDVAVARPMRVISARRLDSTGYETPVDIVSREDYKRLSIKDSEGLANIIFYEKLTDSGVLYVWPVATATGNSLIIVIQRAVDIFDDTEDAGDFPSEMFLALKYALAAMICGGLPIQEQRQIKVDAKEYFFELKADDQETTSFFFQPAMR